MVTRLVDRLLAPSPKPQLSAGQGAKTNQLAESMRWLRISIECAIQCSAVCSRDVRSPSTGQFFQFALLRRRLSAPLSRRPSSAGGAEGCCRIAYRVTLLSHCAALLLLLKLARRRCCSYGVDAALPPLKPQHQVCMPLRIWAKSMERSSSSSCVQSCWLTRRSSACTRGY